MKSQTIFLFSVVALLDSCDKNDRHHNGNDQKNWVEKVVMKDNGPMSHKEVTGDFDEIEVSQAIEAEIIKADFEKVVISAPKNIIDEVLVDNNGGELHIHYKPGIRVMNTHNVSARIYTKDFSKLNANSAASVKVKDKFVQDKMELEVSSSAAVSGDLEANTFTISIDSSGSFDGKIWAVDLDVDASSAASLDLSGKAKNAEISASSGSSISAKDVIVQNLKTDSSSGASVDISASSSINAEASSGGSVNVYKRGNVTNITKNESSGGRVTIQ